MPKEMERRLKAKAKKKFHGNKEKQDAYVYGTMRKTGWTPSTQRHPKGSDWYKARINKRLGG
jgi:hypothetical protein